MTKEEKRKLLEALKLIKKTCMESDNFCSRCPLLETETRTINCYLLEHYPDDWDINDNIGDNWRAFND